MSSVIGGVFIPIRLVKEYYWCPMEAFYKLLAWAERPTESMLAGAESVPRERLVELLEKRHVVRELLWEHPVYSRRLGIGGRADLVAVTDRDTLVVVEAKLSAVSNRALHGKDKRLAVQLAAYAIAAEEALRIPLETSYLYSVEADRLYEIRVTPHLRSLVEHAANALREMLRRGEPPSNIVVPHRRCRVCAYRHTCPYSRA